MDIFLEYIVKHKNNAKDTLFKIGIILLAFILCAVVILFLLGRLFGFEVLVIAAIIYGAYHLVRSKNVEYEYIMTNSYLDIDKIIAKSKRKRLVSIDFKNIEICAAVDDNMHKHEFDNTQNLIKTFDCTGDRSTTVYFIDYAAENGKNRVLFQPPSKIIDEAKKFNPRQVFIK